MFRCRAIGIVMWIVYLKYDFRLNENDYVRSTRLKLIKYQNLYLIFIKCQWKCDKGSMQIDDKRQRPTKKEQRQQQGNLMPTTSCCLHFRFNSVYTLYTYGAIKVEIKRNTRIHYQPQPQPHMFQFSRINRH